MQEADFVDQLAEDTWWCLRTDWATTNHLPWSWHSVILQGGDYANPAQIGFHDALEVNDSAVQVLGNETLRTIAQELVHAVRNNVTIDWTLRKNVRAKMRVMVKRILRRCGYPPDKQEKATQTIIEQAEVLCQDWAVA